MIKTITESALNSLSKEAKISARQRANLNIHDTLDASVQRLFISTEPETYIRPHRHPQAHKWEFFTVLNGEMDLLIFDDIGNMTQRIEMSADAVRAVEIPPNVWHSYICKKPATLALEIKQGAYIPQTEEDLYPWAPAENTPDVNDYLNWMKNTPVNSSYTL